MKRKPKYLYKIVNRKNKSFITSDYGEKYCLSYEDGEIVRAKKGTLGIFCYEKFKQAYELVSVANINGYKVKRVVPLSKPVIPEKISFFQNTQELDNFYLKPRPIFSRVSYTPKGIVCVDEVKIVGELKRNGHLKRRI